MADFVASVKTGAENAWQKANQGWREVQKVATYGLDACGRALKDTDATKDAMQLLWRGVDFSERWSNTPASRAVRNLAGSLRSFTQIQSALAFVGHLRSMVSGEDAFKRPFGVRTPNGLSMGANACQIVADFCSTAMWLSRVGVIGRRVVSQPTTIAVSLFGFKLPTFFINAQRVQDGANIVGGLLGLGDNVRVLAEKKLALSRTQMFNLSMDMTMNVTKVGASVLFNCKALPCVILGIVAASVGAAASLAKFFVESNQKEQFGKITERPPAPVAS